MKEEIRSAELMVNMFRDDATLLSKLQTDPIPILEEAAAKAQTLAPAYQGDVVLYRVAVIVLGSLTLLAAIGSIGLVAIGKTTPEVLVALGSAAVGALVGLFAPSPTNR